MTNTDTTTTLDLCQGLRLREDLGTATELPEELIARVVNELPFNDERGATWRITEVSEMEAIRNAAADANVDWADRMALWDLSDNDGECFLMTLYLDETPYRRIAGVCTYLREAISAGGEEKTVAEAVREVLTYLNSAAAQLVSNFANPAAAVD